MVKVIHPIEKRVDSPSKSFFARSLAIEQAAWDTNFYKRKPKKITATALLNSFLNMVQSGKNTLSAWATHLGIEIGETVEGQSINERLNEWSDTLLEKVLCNALNIKAIPPKISINKKENKHLAAPFNRILLRDSTTLKLPDELRNRFKGGFSSTGCSAVARIQALYDFTGEKWLQFQVNSYTDNDQSSASCIVEELQENDLVLQDMGYFTLDWLEKLTQTAFVITKWKPQTYLYTSENERIDLKSSLKKHGSLDMPVLVGAKKKLPMRLVARKLSAAKAKKHIKEAKNDRHSKANHSKEYYDLLKYEIYLTNIQTDVLSSKGVAKLYGLRWHIEILFKSWKSFSALKMVFSKEDMHEHRVVFSLFAFLIEYIWLQNVIYDRVCQVKKQMKFTKNISTLKYMNVANMLLHQILKIAYLKQIDVLIPYILQQSAYDCRKDRSNTIYKFKYVNKLCIAKN